MIQLFLEDVDLRYLESLQKTRYEALKPSSVPKRGSESCYPTEFNEFGEMDLPVKLM